MEKQNYLNPKLGDYFENYRFKLVEQLPFFLQKATNNYKIFSETQDFNDIKSFTAHQAACRAALTHLQLLLKMASWAQPNIGKNIDLDRESDIEQLIFDARNAINDFEYK